MTHTEFRYASCVFKYYFFKDATQTEFGVATASKILLFSSRKPRRSSVWRWRKTFTFFQIQKATRRFCVERFLLFFKREKRQKINFSKAENQKFSDPKKVRKNDHFGQKPVFWGSHGTPKSGFRARLGLKIFPAKSLRSVESRQNFL